MTFNIPKGKKLTIDDFNAPIRNFIQSSGLKPLYILIHPANKSSIIESIIDNGIDMQFHCLIHSFIQEDDKEVTTQIQYRNVKVLCSENVKPDVLIIVGS